MAMHWNPAQRPRVHALAALIALSLLAAAGCGEDPAADDGTSTTAGSADAKDDDGAIGPRNKDAAAAIADVSLDCPGGPGCDCASHQECDTGLCIETSDGHQCARFCVDTCPNEFGCTPMQRGGDTVNVCIPTWFRVCDPCQHTPDCQVPGLASGHCVKYGDEGSFCGANCDQNDDCPIGSICQLVDTTEGKKLKQCVRIPKISGAKFGTCSCSKAAVKRSASTTCYFDETDGGDKPIKCQGLRTCKKSDLGPCISPTEKLQCTDAQCEGKQDGDKCNDSDDCTTGDSCKAGVCTAGTYSCACQSDADCKDDGDLCNGLPICDKTGDKPTCVANPASVVVCQTAQDTDCAKTECIKQTGTCVSAPVNSGVSCDDGSVCTVGDECNGKGQCVSGTDTCPCKTDVDCAEKDDGNLCNGLLFCNKQSLPHTCKLNLATIVYCNSGSDTDCQKNLCDPKSGQCGMTVAPTGSACNDGNACTTGDACANGSCSSGTDTCDCETDTDCAAKDDGNLCNGVLFCNKQTSKCQPNPATLVVCPTVANNACAGSKCHPGTGKCSLVPQNEGTGCDDGDVCTKGEICKSGVCGDGTNTCLCAEDKDCNKFDDANPCNGSFYCDKSKSECRLNPVTIIDCPQGDLQVCEQRSCNPKSGKCELGPADDGTACDDGNKCTINDACSGGKCTKSQGICPCANDVDCDKFDDGDKCNGTLTCSIASGTCLQNAKTVVVCDQTKNLPCRVNTCAVKTGQCDLWDKKDGTPCGDGTVCAPKTGCKGGKCGTGGANGANCDDGNVCTTDVCDPKLGCVNKPHTGTCGGTNCSSIGQCKDSGCWVTQVGCNDGVACTKDACADGKCSNTSDNSLCDDNNACTNNFCDQKTTTSAGGCQNPAIPGKCKDDAKCIPTGDCKNGSCLGAAAPCDDKNVCTADSCDGAGRASTSTTTTPPAKTARSARSLASARRENAWLRR